MSEKPRFRLLPLVIFASVFMLTIKIGEVWRSFAYLGESERDLIKVSNVSAQESSPSRSEQVSAVSESKGSVSDVTLGKIVEASPSFPSISNNSSFSQNEIDVLQSLAERREELDRREQDIIRQGAMMEAAEKQIDIKIMKLKELQKKLEELIGLYESKEKEKLDSLVRIYSNMKPKDAARIFNDLEMSVLIEIFTQMKESKSSPILAAMDSEKAHALTVELAKKRDIGESISQDNP